MTASGQIHPLDSQRLWHWARNDSASVVPAFGLVRVAGSALVNGRHTILVDQPNGTQNAMTGVIGANGERPILSDRFGWVTFQWPAFVAVDAATAYGELWGPEASSFEATKGNDGLFALGARQTSPSRCLMDHRSHFHRPLFVRFTLGATLAITSATATISVAESYSGITSGVTAPTTANNLEASTNYRWEGASGDVGIAAYDWITGEYTIIHMEC